MPRVYQSGQSDRRGALAKHGPKCLRYQRTKARIGRQRGANVAQIQLARTLTEAIWHMLTRDQPFAPAGAPSLWPPDGPH